MIIFSFEHFRFFIKFLNALIYIKQSRVKTDKYCGPTNHSTSLNFNRKFLKTEYFEKYKNVSVLTHAQNCPFRSVVNNTRKKDKRQDGKDLKD